MKVASDGTPELGFKLIEQSWLQPLEKFQSSQLMTMTSVFSFYITRQIPRMLLLFE